MDRETLDPAGYAAFVATIDQTGDICVDEVTGCAYVTRHLGYARGHGTQITPAWLGLEL